MNHKEFSQQFDVLFNQQYYVTFSIENPVAVDEYEKSVFLTKAEVNFVEELFRAAFGSVEGFEKSEYSRRMIAPLVTTGYFTAEYSTENTPYVKLTEDSHLYKMPKDLLGIVYEQVIFGGEDACAKGRYADVVPVTHDDLHRTLRDPFRGPFGKASLRRVIRVDNSGEVGEDFATTVAYSDVVELISKYPIAKYTLRYVRMPKPIILAKLEEDPEGYFEDYPSIEGITDISECELNPAVHRLILEEAVKLALASKSLNTIPSVPQAQKKESKNDSNSGE